VSGTWRIRERSAFADLRRRGRRARSGPVSVTWLPPALEVAAGDEVRPQVAYAIGKVVGGAVQRNLVRRRLQAVVASVAADLAPGSYLVGAGSAALGASSSELRASLLDALQRLPAPGGLSAVPEAV
jgi:ribonuclease P protein component